MKNWKIFIFLALIELLIFLSIVKISPANASDSGISGKDDEAPSARNSSRTGERRASARTDPDILENLKVLSESNLGTRSTILARIGKILTSNLRKSGSYDEIREVLSGAGEADALFLLRFHIMGAKSKLDVDFDFSEQLKLVRLYANSSNKMDQRLIRVFGEKRGDESLLDDTFEHLSAKVQYSLLKGMAISGHTKGLVHNLGGLSNDKYRGPIFKEILSVAVKKSPSETVAQIGSLPVSVHRDELLAVMIESLVEIGAGEDAKDWIDEIGSDEIRASAKKVFGP